MSRAQWSSWRLAGREQGMSASYPALCPLLNFERWVLPNNGLSGSYPTWMCNRRSGHNPKTSNGRVGDKPPETHSMSDSLCSLQYRQIRASPAMRRSRRSALRNRRINSIKSFAALSRNSRRNFRLGSRRLLALREFFGQSTVVANKRAWPVHQADVRGAQKDELNMSSLRRAVS